eukprot:15330-Pelagococcus_subviridis.AAC.3
MRHHGGTDREVVHEVSVHDVHVQPVRAVVNHPRDLPGEVALVRREQRRRDLRDRGFVRRGIGVVDRRRERRLAPLPMNDAPQRRVRRLVRRVRPRVLRVHLRSRVHDPFHVHHRARGVRDGGVTPRADRRQDRRPERRRVRALRPLERHVRDVRVYLQPQVASRGAAGDDDLGRLVPVRFHRVEDETRSERDPFQNRAKHVRAAVS